MKTTPFFARVLLKGALAGGVALAVIASSPAFAEDAANTATATSTNETPGVATANLPKSEPNTFGLPKEAFDRLSSQQIVELTKSRNTESRAEDVIVPLAGIAVPIVMFVAFVGVVAIVVSHRLKKAKLLHETIRAMIDKGQPIPPEFLQPPTPKRRPKSDLRRGLVMAGIGIGLIVWLAMDGGNKWALGLIPLLMGAAFLVTWKVEQNKNGDSK
ncbi:MAG: hypothetical protein HY301_10960 [Verrucomicrobia bacterium]|nr:hypothetical protein [Verrucomicrobiota bacterium]